MAQAPTALLPAYLIVGTDQLKRERAVERLIARLGDVADFNLDRRAPTAADDPSELVASLNQLPFVAPFRLVLIENGDKLPKPISETLVHYLDDPSPGTVLAVVAEKLARGTRLYKAIAKKGDRSVVDCTPKKRWELPAQVRAMAPKYGKTITPDAAEELVRRTGESTLLIDAQLKALAAFVGQRDPIGLVDVQEHVARTAEVKPWDLVDAVCERDLPAALHLLSLMPGTSPVAIQSFVNGRLRELICAKALERRGSSRELASALGRPAWQVKNHARWARNYRMDELTGALRASAACERVLKGTGDSQTALIVWLCSFMRRS